MIVFFHFVAFLLRGIDLFVPKTSWRLPGALGAPGCLLAALPPGCLLGASWVSPGCFLGVSWVLPGSPDVSQMPPRCLSDASQSIQFISNQIKSSQIKSNQFNFNQIKSNQFKSFIAIETSVWGVSLESYCISIIYHCWQASTSYIASCANRMAILLKSSVLLSKTH